MTGVDPELLSIFRDEAETSLASVLGSVGRWPAAGSATLVPRLHEAFRALHNVKGAARMLGLEAVEEATHALEDALHACRDAARRPDTALDEALEEGVGLVTRAAAGEDCDPALRALAARLRQPGGAAGQAAGARSTPGAASPPGPPGEATPEPAGQEAPAPVHGPDEGHGDDPAERRSRGSAPAAPPGAEGVAPREASAAPPPGAPRPDAPQEADEQAVLRISARRLDGLVAAAAEALAVAERQARLQRDLQTLAETAPDDPTAAAADLSSLAQRGAQELRTLQRAVAGMNAAVRSLGMQPIREAIPRWRIAVHETAQALGREVVLDADVGDTEVDRRVLQALQAPIMHILRNAVDHGLEPPAEREARGKGRTGRVLVRAEAAGSRVRLEVSDDGRGVDPRAVARAAVERGLVDPAAAAALDGEEAAALLFLPGLSTAAEVTRTSGRGVGLDVVATTVRGLGGDVSFGATPTLGGATIRLEVPASMVSTHALLVSAAGQIFALPAGRVVRTERAREQAVTTTQGRPTLARKGAAPLPLVWLTSWAPAAHAAERGAPREDRGTLLLVVLTVEGREVGLVVDTIVGDGDVVIRPLPWNLERVPGVAGAAVLGDGTVAPWLVPEAVVTAREPGGSRAGASADSQAEGARPSRILVVDDSVTSRTLISQILRGAGYEVETATDGVQALARLDAASGQGRGHGDTVWDALVSDVEMPNMDGLELTRRVRVHGRWAHLPVVLVTSRGDAEDLQRGADAGADEYVVKGRFDRDTLLAALRRHIPPRHTPPPPS